MKSYFSESLKSALSGQSEILPATIIKATSNVLFNYQTYSTSPELIIWPLSHSCLWEIDMLKCDCSILYITTLISLQQCFVNCSMLWDIRWCRVLHLCKSFLFFLFVEKNNTLRISTKSGVCILELIYRLAIPIKIPFQNRPLTSITNKGRSIITNILW